MAKALEKRNISEKFFNGGGFTSCPGDVFTIKATSGMISSSISIHITNDGTMNDAAIVTDEWLGLENRIEAWEWVKQCSEVPGRKAMYQIDDNEPIEYKDSTPYKHRFKTEPETFHCIYCHKKEVESRGELCLSCEEKENDKPKEHL